MGTLLKTFVVGLGAIVLAIPALVLGVLALALLMAGFTVVAVFVGLSLALLKLALLVILPICFVGWVVRAVFAPRHRVSLIE